MPELPGDPSNVPPLDPTKAIDKNTPSIGGGSSFESYMKEDETAATGASKGAASPYEPKPVAPMKPATPENIYQDMGHTMKSLGTIHDQLHTKNLKLKSSETGPISRHLKDAHSNIQDVAKKLGVPVNESPVEPGRQNPVERFLGMVTDGQNLLESSMSQIKNIQLSPTKFNSADFLSIQAKMMKAQQCLDFSSVVLGKAVEAIKALFNIQL